MYPNHKTTEDKLFFETACQEMKAVGYDVVITDTKNVNTGDSLRVSGYFSEVDKVIRVGGKNSSWFSIFIHEYCHWRQSVEKPKVWTRTYKYDDFDAWILKQIEMKEVRIDKNFHVVRNMELDCEKRTVKMIEKHHLSINPILYTQMANAYIFYYAYLRKYRKWYSHHSPHMTRAIYKTLPKTFLRPSQYNHLPEAYEEAVNKLCF